MAYTDDGEVATCDIIVEGEVIDAALNTAYNGLIEVDPEDPDFNEAAWANTWYRYVNNTENDLMVTFDARMIEAAEATLNAPYAIYYKDNYIEPVEYSAGELETAQIYVDPGEEIYIRPQVNDMTTSVYDFTINATAYNPVAYTIGTDVKNVVLDRKDYTEYTFTPSTPGEYELTASSRTPFYWQLEDVENGYEAIVCGWEDSAVVTTFNFEPNHKYAVRFSPKNRTDEGTLKFTLEKSEESIINGTVNTQYNSNNTDVLNAGKTRYYKFELGDAEINNSLNVYELTEMDDGLSYVVLDSDLYTEHETYSSSNGYRLYIDEPTTIYVKVSNNSDSAIAPEFILREYDRSLTQIDDVDEGSNEIAAYSVQCYEFTAPENGRYKFDFAASEYSVSVNYEVYFGDEMEFSSEYSAYNDYTGWYDEDGNYNKGYENKLDMSYTLSAVDKVYFKVTGDFNEENKDTVVPYNWSVSCEEAYPVTELALDTPTTGATVDGQKQYFKFTAPNNGVYYFWSQARAYMYGDLYSELGGECLSSDYGSGSEGNFCIRYRLKAGQTVYLCSRQYNDRDVKYQVVVSTTNNSTKWTPTYEHTAMTLGEEYVGNYYDVYDFSTFSFTAPEAGTYVFTSNSEYNMEGVLYSDDAMEEELANDDSAENDQFKIVYALEEGETVYLQPHSWSDEVPYTVKVTKMPNILASIGGDNDDSTGLNIEATSAIVEVVNDYDSMLLYCASIDLSSGESTGKNFKAWISETFDFADAEEVDADNEFTWYRPTGTYYVKIESVDENNLGGIRVNFVDEGEYVEPVVEEYDEIPLGITTAFIAENEYTAPIMQLTAPMDGTYTVHAQNQGIDMVGSGITYADGTPVTDTYTGEGGWDRTYTFTLEKGDVIYLSFSAWSVVSGPVQVDVTVNATCSECNGVNGHMETCSHYGEDIEDGDEDDSLIFDVTAWSDYNGGWSADYEATNTYTGDSVSIELPAAYSGYFGAKYSGIDLEAGTYKLTFDLAVIGMADVEICVRDAEGNAVFEAMGDSGYDPVTNTFTFTIDEAIEGGSLTMVFYTDSSMEGSIGASNVSVTNISLVELIPVGEDDSED